MEALPFPARINVEVTNRCNQTCRLCPRQDFSRPLGLMDPDRFRRLADEVAGHDTVLWLHFLGEPLLHPRLAELVRYAVAAGVRSVGLSTNATLLDREAADELLDSGLARLDISLDADDPDEYRHMRGTDDFERAHRHARDFLARRAGRGLDRPAVSLQYMRTAELAAVEAEVVARWEPLLGPDDFVKTIDPAPFHGAVAEGTQPGAGAPRPPCPWLFGSLMVLQDGTVTMCGADWDAQEPLGHLDDGPLADLWQGPEATRRRRAHLEGRFADVGLCGDCTDWFLADGHGYRNALPGRPERPGPVTVMLRRT